LTEFAFSFDVLTSVKIAGTDLKLSWQKARVILPSDLQNSINEHWQKSVVEAGKTNLFNGQLCSLLDWQQNASGLKLALGLTDYKSLLYSNSLYEKNEMEPFNPRALGISVVLISSDAQIILMRRSELVGEFPSCLDVWGGHIDPTEHRNETQPDPVVGIAQSRRYSSRNIKGSCGMVNPEIE